MSTLKDKERFRKEVNELIDQFSSPVRERSFLGADPGPTLEHVTRRHFIDPFLRALGWDLSQLNEEIIEEARTRGETTLRLDYLGINQQTRIPLLIVEAKSWESPFVERSVKAGRAEGTEVSKPISLLCAAIEHCKAGGEANDSPVSRVWADYIEKLYQYVKSVKDESGHVITRVATLSGQWLVTFNDPGAIFLTTGEFSPFLIGIYRGRELVDQAGVIFDEIARSSISNAFPSMIRPSLLPAYIRTNDIKRAYRALWVSRQSTGASWKPKPSLDFDVAMVLERQDGALLTVVDQSLQGYPMSHEYPEMGGHIAAIEAQSDELLRRVNAELGATLRPSAVETFTGFSASNVNGDQNVIPLGHQPCVYLGKIVGRPGEFLLVTGTTKHFLLGVPAVDPCDCHDWVFCQKQAQEQGERPIVSRSVKPKAFFISGEGHHCAHRLVHDRRIKRCQIDAFEEYLCCRACVLQTFCWQTQELATLPCGTVAAVVPT